MADLVNNMEIVTGSTGVAHVTPIDDAVRNVNTALTLDKVVFTFFENFAATRFSNNEVHIGSGYGMMRGRLFKTDRGVYSTIPVRTRDIGEKRADLIIVQYSMEMPGGTEKVELVIREGEPGTDYVDPSISEGDINAGASLDEFPLYRIKLDGTTPTEEPIVIEPLFEVLPVGGRVEKQIDDLIQQIEHLGAGDMLKMNFCTGTSPDFNNVIKPGAGGTGKETITEGKALVGGPDNTYTERSIDSTTGGIQNSSALTTSGALYATKAQLQTAFQDGVDTIYNAVVAKGAYPFSSTPTDIAAAIATMGEMVHSKFILKTGAGTDDWEVSQITEKNGNEAIFDMTYTDPYGVQAVLERTETSWIRQNITQYQYELSTTSPGGEYLCIMNITITNPYYDTYGDYTFEFVSVTSTHSGHTHTQNHELRVIPYVTP